MYLRYGELSWDATDATKPPPDNLAGAGRPSDGRSRSNGPGASSNGHRLPVVRLNGVELHAIGEAECIKHILDELDGGRGGVVVTPNLDHLRRCVKDLSFSALVAEADLVVADGMPLVWASRLQGTPLPERVAGSDLVSSLSAAAAERGRSVFMLGGAPGTAEAAAKILQERYPGLKVAGSYCPPFGFESDAGAMTGIVNALSEADADIVYVALGSPKQEVLVNRIRRVLPKAWWLGIGNSFSFLCGDVRRAPLWMQRSGLEWVHRLRQEPRRLFKRYILVGLPFAGSLLGKALLKGVTRRLKRVIAPRRSHEMSKPVQAHDGKPVVALMTPQPPLHAAASHDSNGDGADSLQVTSPRTGLDGVDSGESSLARLRGLVLLGGTVRATKLTASIDRSVLDLPLDDGGSILNHWLSHAADLAWTAKIENLPVRVLVDRDAPEPTSAASRYYGTFGVERDLSEYRGTGGVLRDLAVDYDDDDLLLIANAAQVLLDPLAGIASALDRTSGQVGLVSHQDGTPSGIMLVTCKTLRLIPKTGFVDMKEQALPLIASRFKVTVSHRRRPTGLPVRTLSDYILALRVYHRKRLGKPAFSDPLAEDWRPTFAIVEPGAVVDSRARIHDSVVLRGGSVEPGGVLVRSIVCPGGVVRRERTAVDQFVTAVGSRQ